MHRRHYYLDVRSESLPSLPPLFVGRKRASQKEFYCSSRRPQHLYRTTAVNKTKAWRLSFVTLNRELCFPSPQKKWPEGAAETTEFDIKTKPDNYSGKMAKTQWKAPGTRRFIKIDTLKIVGLIKLLLLICHCRRNRNCHVLCLKSDAWSDKAITNQVIFQQY